VAAGIQRPIQFSYCYNHDGQPALGTEVLIFLPACRPTGLPQAEDASDFFLIFFGGAVEK